jgi:hypothetical protein
VVTARTEATCNKAIKVILESLMGVSRRSKAVKARRKTVEMGALPNSLWSLSDTATVARKYKYGRKLRYRQYCRHGCIQAEFHSDDRC